MSTPSTSSVRLAHSAKGEKVCPECGSVGPQRGFIREHTDGRRLVRRECMICRGVQEISQTSRPF